MSNIINKVRFILLSSLLLGVKSVWPHLPPTHLADDCELITNSRRRRLRSADANALTVPRTYTRLRDRSFLVFRWRDRKYMEQSSRHTAKT